MLEYREKNGMIHIVSDNELIAFAWAAYYADHSILLVNGKIYKVIHPPERKIEFADGTDLPFGCYAIFKSDAEVRVFDDCELNRIRKENPLEHIYSCFSDEQFLTVECRKVSSIRDNLEDLARIYLYEQNKNIIYNRENASSYSYEKGRLVGFCMAHSYDIDETHKYLKINTRTGATILKIDKDELLE